MHLSPPELRAYLDAALPASEQAAAAEHLAHCGQCTAELGLVEARAARVNNRLAALAPAPAEAARAAPAALDLLRHRQRKERLPMFKSLAQRRSVWVTAIALLALAFSFAFAPVRTFAGQFLGLFRVQQIAVLPVDIARLESLHDDPTLIDEFNHLFADAVKVTKKPGEPVTVASAAEAGALAGFSVRELGGALGSPVFNVSDSAAFEVVIDRARAQGILDEAGRGDLRLPESVDGATIAVSVPAGANVAYNCPDLLQNEDGGFERGEPGGLRNCVLLGQIPSPSVETPPNLDMVQLAELALQFTGMSTAEAQAFSQSVDWTSTLVVPIPMNAAINEQVMVDGVTGTLVFRGADDGVPARYTLLWVKDGIVYALSAFGSAEDAVALANTIQ
jgi:hypothetical protein